MSLQDAVDVLDEHAAGLPLSNRSKLNAGALALQTEALMSSDRNLLDAVADLQRIGAEGELALNQAERERAAHLASLVAGLIRRKSRSS
jgi:hypothetical protein